MPIASVVVTTHLGKVFKLYSAAAPLSAPGLLCLSPIGQSSPDLETLLPKGQIDSFYISQHDTLHTVC